MNTRPQFRIDDSRVRTGVPAALVRQLPQVDTVTQQLVQVLLVNLSASSGRTRLGRPGLSSDALSSQGGGDLSGRADSKHFLEDATHHRHLGLVDDQEAVIDGLYAIASRPLRSISDSSFSDVPAGLTCSTPSKRTLLTPVRRAAARIEPRPERRGRAACQAHSLKVRTPSQAPTGLAP